MTARARAAALVSASAALAGCAPRARPLVGAPPPPSVQLPSVALAGTPQRVPFRWRYIEDGFSARGDGVARIAPPDSARLDFVLAGGFGSGWAVLVGDTLRTPSDDLARRLVPPPPLLWAALGRLSVPAGRDTTLRVDADTLRAELVGATDVWRVTLVNRRLVALDRIVAGRTRDRVTRDSAHVRYADLAGRRSLVIDLQPPSEAAAFPREIWSR